MREPAFESDGVVEEELFVRPPPRIPRYADSLQPQVELMLFTALTGGGIAVLWGAYELVRWVWRLALS